MPLQNPQDIAAHAALPYVHHDGPKVKLETRDTAYASGDVSYTGYGFQPTGLIILANFSTSMFSVGSAEPALAEHCGYKESNDFDAGAYLVWLGATADHAYAVLKTYDADGFTLTWTKVNNPAGVANLHVFAFK